MAAFSRLARHLTNLAAMSQIANASISTLRLSSSLSALPAPSDVVVPISEDSSRRSSADLDMGNKAVAEAVSRRIADLTRSLETLHPHKLLRDALRSATYSL